MPKGQSVYCRVDKVDEDPNWKVRHRYLDKTLKVRARFVRRNLVNRPQPSTANLPGRGQPVLRDCQKAQRRDGEQAAAPGVVGWVKAVCQGVERRRRPRRGHRKHDEHQQDERSACAGRKQELDVPLPRIHAQRSVVVSSLISASAKAFASATGMPSLRALRNAMARICRSRRGGSTGRGLGTALTRRRRRRRPSNRADQEPRSLPKSLTTAVTTPEATAVTSTSSAPGKPKPSGSRRETRRLGRSPTACQVWSNSGSSSGASRATTRRPNSTTGSVVAIMTPKCELFATC